MGVKDYRMKRKRQASKKPTAIPKVPAPLDGKPLISKLSSDNLEDRQWAAAAISNVVEQPDVLQQLISDNVIGALINALKAGGSNWDVQSEVAGALRNLAFYKQECIIEMFHKDAIPTIFEFIPLVCTFQQSGVEYNGFNLARPNRQRISKRVFYAVY